MIRTLVEIQGGRVSIRETADETVVTVKVDGAMSDEKPGSGWHRINGEFVHSSELGASGLSVTDLRRQVTELEAGRKADHKEIMALWQKVQEYDQDRKTERERADQNKDWAERAEVKLEEQHKTTSELRDLLSQRDRSLMTAADDLARSQALVREERENTRKILKAGDEQNAQSLAARDRILIEATTELKRLTAQIGKVSGAVYNPIILAALQTPWHNWSETQAVALTRAVQDVRAAIGSPGPDTSQA